MAEPAPAAAPFREAASSAGVTATLPATETVPVLAVPMRWSQALKPCVLAALVVLVLMFLGLNPLVAMPSVGFLAVIFARQGRPGNLVRIPEAIRLGAFSGLLCFGLIALIAAVASTMPDLRLKLHDEILANAQKWAAARPSDAQIQSTIEQLKTPDGFMALMIVGGAMLFVISIVLGAMGGIAGATIFGRKR